MLEPPEELPAGVEAKWMFAPNIGKAEKDLGQAIYHDFLPSALASGSFKPLPKANVNWQWT